MSSISIAGDSSGSISLTVPSVAGTNTATLPAATGTVMVSGNMPAFSAYANANQNLTASTYTKVILNNKLFDTASYFDSTTNYRFTPLVAGYYQITGLVAFNSTGANPTSCFTQIYKNGSVVKSSSGGNANGVLEQIVAGLIYMNGSTDYIELYAWATGGSGTLYVQGSLGQYAVYFDGVLVRSA